MGTRFTIGWLTWYYLQQRHGRIIESRIFWYWFFLMAYYPMTFYGRSNHSVCFPIGSHHLYLYLRLRILLSVPLNTFKTFHLLFSEDSEFFTISFWINFYPSVICGLHAKHSQQLMLRLIYLQLKHDYCVVDVQVTQVVTNLVFTYSEWDTVCPTYHIQKNIKNKFYVWNFFEANFIIQIQRFEGCMMSS